MHLCAVHDARALGQFHPEFGEPLAVTHPDEFAGAGLRAGILADDGQLGDALVEQRSDLSGDDQLTEPILLRGIEFGQRAQQLLHRVAQRGALSHGDPLVGQRRSRQPPPVVDLSDHHLVGDEHVVEEHLVEQFVAGDLPERSHDEAR